MTGVRLFTPHGELTALGLALAAVATLVVTVGFMVLVSWMLVVAFS